MKFLISLAVAFSVSSIVTAAEGTKDHYIDSVIASCNNLTAGNGLPKTEPSQCTNYLNAFISGALVYDTMLVEHFKRDHKEKSDFLQRVYRTRLGINDRSTHLTEAAPFCVTEKLIQEQLTQRIIEYLPTNIIDQESLHLNILSGLSEQFPCN